MTFDPEIFDKNNPFYIGPLENTEVLLNFDQAFLGRSIVVPKKITSDLESLEPLELAKIMTDVAHVGRILKREFGATLVNYASLGNEVRQLHWHVIPRYDGDQNAGRPPWPVKQKNLVSEDEAQMISSRIRSCL